MTQLFDMSFRADPVGGELDLDKASLAAQQLDGKAHLVLVIHGFNNSLKKAQDNYADLFKRLGDATTAGQDWAFGAAVVRVYWPGDADWGIFSALVYPTSIGVANDTGVELAAILRRLSGLVTGELLVDFICHSRGNRVALKALSMLDEVPGLRVRRCLHMAAAVPTWQLEKTGHEMKLGLARERLGFGATSVHSANDNVLSAVFPVGESLKAGKEGFNPTALGHEHWPVGDGLPLFAQAARDELGHGDYWHRLDLASIHGALEMGPVLPRRINSSLIPGADMPIAEPLQARQTVARDVGESLALNG